MDDLLPKHWFSLCLIIGVAWPTGHRIFHHKVLMFNKQYKYREKRWLGLTNFMQTNVNFWKKATNLKQREIKLILSDVVSFQHVINYVLEETKNYTSSQFSINLSHGFFLPFSFTIWLRITSWLFSGYNYHLAQQELSQPNESK